MAEETSGSRMFALMAPNDIERFLDKLGTHRTDIMSRRRQLEEILPADSPEFRLNAITAQNLDLTLTQLNKIINKPEGFPDAQGRQKPYTSHGNIQEAASFIEETLEDYLNLPFNAEKAAKDNEMMERARYAVPGPDGSISRGPYLYDRFRALQTGTIRIYSDETGGKLREPDITTFLDPSGNVESVGTVFSAPSSSIQQYEDFPYPEDDPTRDYELNRALLEKAQREPVSDWSKPGSLAGARIYEPQSNLVFEQLRRWDPYADVSEEMRQRSVQKQIELQYGLNPTTGLETIPSQPPTPVAPLNNALRPSSQRLTRPDGLADGGPVLADRTPLLPSDPLFIQDDLGYSPEVLSDMQAADVTNYTGIFPPSYEGNFITQDIISPLLKPWFRREEIRPEEFQEDLEQRGLRINPRTGMPELTSTVEVVPGEYGPIERGGGITGLLSSGILNFLKAKNFLSTPEGREQAATMAQELPGQLTQAGQDYMGQQMDMADRGLQETYDPETGEMVDFNVPLTVAEAMVGTGVAQPAVQLQRGEFIAPMVQKVKGGVQLPVSPYKKAYLEDYRKAMQEQGDQTHPFNLAFGEFSEKDLEGVLKKIEKYYRDEAGTPSDPIRAMLLRGDLEPQLGTYGWRSDSFLDIDPMGPHNFQLTQRNVPGIPPSLLTGIRQQADLADEIIVLQNQLRKLDETRGPADMGLPHEGYRNAEDLAQARSLQNQITKLSEKDTALTQQTADRQFFDRVYDEALPIEGSLLIDMPGESRSNIWSSDVGLFANKKRHELRQNVGDEIAQRQAQYEQLSLKFDPTQPFQGFANQAELKRYRDLALGPRFPQEAAPFSAQGAVLTQPSFDYFRQPKFDEYSDLFEEGGPMERAMYEQEILFSPQIEEVGLHGLGFLEPKTFVEHLKLLDPNKVKNMSFSQMVKAGVDANTQDVLKVLKGNKPAELAKALKKNPKLRSKINPQILLEGKGLERIIGNESGTILRLLRPEETALEGALMGHSVGWYNDPAHPTYNSNIRLGIPGGKSGFLAGKKRVYSLRDPQTGMPRATIDLAFDTETNLPLDVQQVKARANAENFSLEDRELIAAFLKQVGVKSETSISEKNDIGLYLRDVFDEQRYAEGGIVSLANGGAVEHGIVTL